MKVGEEKSWEIRRGTVVGRPGVLGREKGVGGFLWGEEDCAYSCKIGRRRRGERNVCHLGAGCSSLERGLVSPDTVHCRQENVPCK